jgi:endonuclease YncB( thermonuclease family)
MTKPTSRRLLRCLFLGGAFWVGLQAGLLSEAGTGSLVLGDLELAPSSSASAEARARVPRGALSPGEEVLLEAPLRHGASGSFEVSWGAELIPAGSGNPQTLGSGSGWRVGSYSEQTLAAGVRLPDGLRWGRYFLELNVVAGSRRLTTSREVHVGRAADLEVSELRLTGVRSGASLDQGQRVAVEVLVSNRGQRTASWSALDLRFSRNDAITAYDPAGGQIRIAPLSGGESRRERFDLVIPNDLGPGSYYIGARVDAAREVDELVEGGTASTSRRYSVVARVAPDLVAVSVAADSRAAQPGGLLEVSRAIENVGQSASGPLEYALVLSADRTLDASDREVWRGSLASLDPGEESSGQVQVRLPGDLPSGTYTLGLRVDPDDVLAESREDNGEVVSAATLEIRRASGRPDLRAKSVRPRHYTTRPGDRLEVERSLENSGGDAGPFSYTILLSRDARLSRDDEVLYRYRYYQGLPAGERREGSVTVTIPSDVRVGHYYVGIRVDGEAEVDEADEGNQDQIASFAIRVERGQEVLRFEPRRVYMNDGDTLRVDGRSYRLLGYDTPEKSSGAFRGNQEPHASRATEHARSLLYGAEELALHLGETDRYNRTLAHAFLDGQSLAVLMVEAEQAYETIRIFGNGGFYELGGEIIDAARGRNPPFQAPYRWRQSHKR